MATGSIQRRVEDNLPKLKIGKGCVIGVNAKKTQKLSEQNSQYALEIDTLNGSLSEKESIIEEHEASIQELEKKNNNLEQELSKY